MDENCWHLHPEKRLKNKKKSEEAHNMEVGEISEVENLHDVTRGLTVKVKKLSKDQGIDLPIPKKVNFNANMSEEEKVYQH